MAQAPIPAPGAGTRPARRMTGGQAVAECIALEGVTHAFCVPGESFLNLIDALYEHPSVRLIATRHEEGAGFMAEGYAKACHRTGVAMATRGVGSTHMSIALHTAHQDSTPLVAFIGQVETDFRGREAFQEVELADFYGHICKWTVEAQRADRLPEIVQRAFRVARSGRPGPVLVSLPADVLEQEAEMRFEPVGPTPAARPAEDDVRRAVEMIAGARFPVILAGGGVLRAGATPRLIELAEELGAAVFTAFRRFDAFPNQHELYLGASTLGMRKELRRYLQEADVMLAVGTRFSEITTQGYEIPAKGTRVIHVDISPDVVGKLFSPAIGMVADAGEALGELVAEAKRQRVRGGAAYAGRLRSIAEARETFVRLTTPRHDPAGAGRVDPQGVIAQMLEVLPEDAAIVTDAGNFSGWAARFYRFRRPGTHFGPTSGAMGYGLPAAIGVQIATPHRPVICLAGDGGFPMTMSELETAVREGAPVISIVFNNAMYGTIRAHQEKKHPGRQIATALGNPDFAAVARAFGCHGETVRRTSEFGPALRRALAAGKPAVIELHTDPAKLSAAAAPPN